jgi:uncharacterized linocin/CFP29 family protein
MTVPQPGRPAIPQPVLSPLTAAAIFLVVTVSDGGGPAARELLGYESHDATSAELYLTESPTFLVHTTEAAVALTAAP